MQIKLSEKDVKYFEMLNSSITELQQKIAILEIEKTKNLQAFFSVTEKFNEFSKQIRAKYDVTHPDAEIDLDQGIISWPDDNQDAGSSGTETQQSLKSAPVKPTPPPVRIVEDGVDPDIPQDELKKMLKRKGKR